MHRKFNLTIGGPDKQQQEIADEVTERAVIFYQKQQPAQ